MMGATTTLRELLQSICHNTQWKYAVFWKLDQLELTCEDSYVADENTMTFLSMKPETTLSVRGDSMECSIKMVVMSLSCYTYALGEGIVGKVASERKHNWIYTDEIMQGEYPEEWIEQASAGIKTSLLVPVLPFGVVQLGSLDMVFEDIREVIRIKDYFGSTCNTSGAHKSFSPGIHLINPYIPLAKPSDNLPLTMNVINQLFQGDAETYTDETVWQSTLMELFSDDTEEPQAVDPSAFTDNVAEGDLSAFSFFGDELDIISSINHRSISSPPVIPHSDQKHLKRKDYDHNLEDLKSLSFPSSSELHGALGLISDGHSDFLHNTIPSISSERDDSLAFCQLPESCPIFEDPDAWFASERETGELLDAMIAKSRDSLDDDGSCELGCSKSCSNSSSKCSESCLTLCRTEDTALDLEESVLLKHQILDLASENSPKNFCMKSSDKKIDGSLGPKQTNTTKAPCRKGPKTNANRKRGNANDVGKSKPRDRQLIQDRIKELRKLTPDGSKCSIDALLERTIKHIRFLQNVPDRAAKLRHSAETKVERNEWDSSRLHTCYSKPAWGFDLQKMWSHYPLITEDPDHPGEARVEMVCDDTDLFLEIAQVIKRLKLSILTGVLEIKSGISWAQFLVEVPRGFHQMDVLLPLVQLLQIKNTPTTRAF